MLPHMYEDCTALTVVQKTFPISHKRGSQINNSKPMHKQTNRFLMRKGLMKPAKVTATKRGKLQMARPSPECLCPSENVYGLAVEVIMECLSTLALIATVRRPPKPPNVGGLGGRWVTSKGRKRERESESSTLLLLFFPSADVVVE